jgi:hypothetical protein
LGHQKHCEEDWYYDKYPTLLLVAPDYRTERYMLKVVEARYFDFDVWVTHKKRLVDSQDGKVWMTSFKPTITDKIKQISRVLQYKASTLRLTA